MSRRGGCALRGPSVRFPTQAAAIGRGQFTPKPSEETGQERVSRNPGSERVPGVPAQLQARGAALMGRGCWNTTSSLAGVASAKGSEETSQQEEPRPPLPLATAAAPLQGDRPWGAGVGTLRGEVLSPAQDGS